MNQISIAWKTLSEEDLLHEWTHENLNTLFFSGYPSEEENSHYRDKFIERYSSFADEVTLTNSQIDSVVGVYAPSDVDHLRKITGHMGKNLDYLLSQFQGGSLPTPMVLSKQGQLRMLGGRTRLALARLLGGEVIVSVVREDLMRFAFQEETISKFIRIGSGGLIFLTTKEQREFLVNAHLNGDDSAINQLIASLPVNCEEETALVRREWREFSLKLKTPKNYRG